MANIPSPGEVFHSEDGITSLVLDDSHDPNYKPTEEELREYASYVGIDADAEPHLMPIACEGLLAALPAEWRMCRTGDGDVYYFNFVTGESLWDHPLDESFRTKVKQERARYGAEGATNATRAVTKSIPDDAATTTATNTPAAAGAISRTATAMERKRPTRRGGNTVPCVGADEQHTAGSKPAVTLHALSDFGHHGKDSNTNTTSTSRAIAPTPTNTSHNCPKSADTGTHLHAPRDARGVASMPATALATSTKAIANSLFHTPDTQHAMRATPTMTATSTSAGTTTTPFSSHVVAATDALQPDPHSSSFSSSFLQSHNNSNDCNTAAATALPDNSNSGSSCTATKKSSAVSSAARLTSMPAQSAPQPSSLFLQPHDLAVRVADDVNTAGALLSSSPSWALAHPTASTSLTPARAHTARTPTHSLGVPQPQSVCGSGTAAAAPSVGAVPVLAVPHAQQVIASPTTHSTFFAPINHSDASQPSNGSSTSDALFHSPNGNNHTKHSIDGSTTTNGITSNGILVHISPSSLSLFGQGVSQSLPNPAITALPTATAASSTPSTIGFGVRTIEAAIRARIEEELASQRHTQRAERAARLSAAQGAHAERRVALRVEALRAEEQTAAAMRAHMAEVQAQALAELQQSCQRRCAELCEAKRRQAQESAAALRGRLAELEQESASVKVLCEKEVSLQAGERVIEQAMRVCDAMMTETIAGTTRQDDEDEEEANAAGRAVAQAVVAVSEQNAKQATGGGARAEQDDEATRVSLERQLWQQTESYCHRLAALYMNANTSRDTSGDNNNCNGQSLTRDGNHLHDDGTTCAIDETCCSAAEQRLLCAEERRLRSLSKTDQTGSSSARSEASASLPSLPPSVREPDRAEQQLRDSLRRLEQHHTTVVCEMRAAHERELAARQVRQVRRLRTFAAALAGQKRAWLQSHPAPVRTMPTFAPIHAMHHNPSSTAHTTDDMDRARSALGEEGCTDNNSKRNCGIDNKAETMSDEHGHAVHEDSSSTPDDNHTHINALNDAPWTDEKSSRDAARSRARGADVNEGSRTILTSSPVRTFTVSALMCEAEEAVSSDEEDREERKSSKTDEGDDTDKNNDKLEARDHNNQRSPCVATGEDDRVDADEVQREVWARGAAMRLAAAAQQTAALDELDTRRRAEGAARREEYYQRQLAAVQARLADAAAADADASVVTREMENDAVTDKEDALRGYDVYGMNHASASSTEARNTSCVAQGEGGTATTTDMKSSGNKNDNDAMLRRLRRRVALLEQQWQHCCRTDQNTPSLAQAHDEATNKAQPAAPNMPSTAAAAAAAAELFSVSAHTALPAMQGTLSAHAAHTALRYASSSPCYATLSKLRILVQHAAAAHAWLHLRLRRASPQPRNHLPSASHADCIQLLPVSAFGAASSSAATAAAAATRKVIRTTPIHAPGGSMNCVWSHCKDAHCAATAAANCEEASENNDVEDDPLHSPIVHVDPQGIFHLSSETPVATASHTAAITDPAPLRSSYDAMLMDDTLHKTNNSNIAPLPHPHYTHRLANVQRTLRQRCQHVLARQSELRRWRQSWAADMQACRRRRASQMAVQLQHVKWEMERYAHALNREVVWLKRCVRDWTTLVANRRGESAKRGVAVPLSGKQQGAKGRQTCPLSDVNSPTVKRKSFACEVGTGIGRVRRSRDQHAEVERWLKDQRPIY